MRISEVVRISMEELNRAGGDIPKWLNVLLGGINRFIDVIGQALKNNLSFRDNFLGFQDQRKFTHGIELEILPQYRNLRVQGVLFLDSGIGGTISGWKLTRKQSGSIGIKINFAEGGSTQSDVTLFVLQG